MSRLLIAIAFCLLIAQPMQVAAPPSHSEGNQGHSDEHPNRGIRDYVNSQIQAALAADVLPDSDKDELIAAAKDATLAAINTDKLTIGRWKILQESVSFCCSGIWNPSSTPAMRCRKKHTRSFDIDLNIT